MSLSKNLTRLQTEHAESGYRLAKAIGVTQQSIANWKNGINPHPRNAKALADHYGVPVDELYS